MPHVNVKYFSSSSISKNQKFRLSSEISRVIVNIFHCDEGSISIALEPVDDKLWDEKVYVPEISGRKDLLCKKPLY